MKRYNPFIAVTIIAFAVLIWITSDFDFRANSGWRAADQLSIAENYANGADFSNPTAATTRNRFGEAFIETSLPIYPYIIGLIARGNLHERSECWKIYGEVRIQCSAPHLDLINYQSFTRSKNNRTETTVVFEKYRSFVARVFDKGNNANKFFLSLPFHLDPSNLDVTLNNKPLTLVSDTKGTSPVRMFSFSLPDGVNKLTFKYPTGSIDGHIAVHSMGSKSNYLELVWRYLSALSIIAFAYSVYRILQPLPGNPWFKATLSYAIVPCYLFLFILHEEIISATLSIFAIGYWFHDKSKFDRLTARKLIPFALLGLATAIRVPYFIYGLFFPLLLILECQGSHREKVASLYQYLKTNITLLSAAFTLMLLPSVLWFSHTQYRVRVGSDSIDIFTRRVFFDSISNSAKWKELSAWVFQDHFPIAVAILFTLSITLVLFRRSYDGTRPIVNFLLTSFCVALILTPFLLDSGAHHDYYYFPVSLLFYIACFMCFLNIVGSVKAPALRVLLISIILIVLYTGMSSRFAFMVDRAFRYTMDDYDYYVTARYHRVIYPKLQPQFLIDSGPQSYFLSGKSGYRPLDIRGGDFQSFKASFEATPIFDFKPDVVYYCDQTSPYHLPHINRYFQESRWTDVRLINYCHARYENSGKR